MDIATDKTTLDLQNRILEFSFGLTRKRHWKDLMPVVQSLSGLLVNLRQDITTTKSTEVLNDRIRLLIMLYKMVGHTRDTVAGKGEQDLTYAMIFVWYQFFPVPALQLLRLLPQYLDASHRPFGSWKDIKHFCLLVRTFSKKGETDPLIDSAVAIMNDQLHRDHEAWTKAMGEYTEACANPMRLTVPVPPRPEDHISMACKWIPRESSAFKWLYPRFVVQWMRTYDPAYLQNVRDENHFEAMFRKSKMEYRKRVAFLSKAWAFPQTAQCQQQWADIDPKKVSSVTLQRNKRAFLNLNAKGEQRVKTKDDVDREKCARKFEGYYCGGGLVSVGCGGNGGGTGGGNGGGTGWIDLRALFRDVCNVSVNLTEQYRLQKTWKRALDLLPSDGFVLPVLDLSLYDQDVFYDAMAIALLLCHKSSMGKRVLACDQSPIWLNFDSMKEDVIEMVRYVKQVALEKHIGSGWAAAMRLVLASLKESGVVDMSLLKIVLIGDFGGESFAALHEEVMGVFGGGVSEGDTSSSSSSLSSSSSSSSLSSSSSSSSLSSSSSSSSLPHVLFWNVGQYRSSILAGSPVVQQKRCVVNGVSLPVVHHVLNEPSYDPWKMLVDQLSHDRYNVLENYMHDLLSQGMNRD